MTSGSRDVPVIEGLTNLEPLLSQKDATRCDPWEELDEAKKATGAATD